MGFFDIFANKSKQKDSFEPNYDKLTPEEVALEFRLRQKGISAHTGTRLAEDIEIMSLLAKKYKYLPAIHFCIDNFENCDEYERIGCELGDAVCLYRYYDLDRIKNMKPKEAEECIGRAVSAGASAAYLTLGDYYRLLGDEGRALDIYKLAHSLSAKGATERIASIDPHLAEQLTERPTAQSRPKSSLSARLKGENK